MAEPQPDSIHEGVGALDIEDEVPALPKSAEDRKAAAALNSVADNDDDYYSGEPAKEVDQEALGRAMKNLGGGGTKSVGGREDDKGDGDKKKAAVKVDPSDVALLVDELDLSKNKAIELLKNHEGDAVRAMRSFVTVTASVVS